MNLVAKLRRLSADVEEIKARLDALDSAVVGLAAATLPPTFYTPPLPEPISLPDPIAPAIVQQLPRKRGRPPKPKS